MDGGEEGGDGGGEEDAAHLGQLDGRALAVVPVAAARAITERVVAALEDLRCPTSIRPRSPMRSCLGTDILVRRRPAWMASSGKLSPSR